MLKTLIEFKNINLKFKDNVIFSNFNLKINQNDKVVIVGPSGIGKSSLFNLLLGLNQPESGQIFFNSKKINSDNVNKLRSQIAYVDQEISLGNGVVKNVMADYFSFTVNKNLKITKKNLMDLFNEFLLDPAILNQNVEDLSGGEKQRLGLVIALLLKRPILLLDEISSSLDADLTKSVIAKILALKNKTVILIAHDLEWQKQKNIKIFNFKDKKWKQ